jgi:hypothetical protein
MTTGESVCSVALAHRAHEWLLFRENKTDCRGRQIHDSFVKQDVTAIAIRAPRDLRVLDENLPETRM